MHSTLDHSGSRRLLGTLTFLAVLTATAGAHAASTPEQQCQNSRFSAAAKYGACVQKALGKWFAGGELAALDTALGKCVTK